MDRNAVCRYEMPSSLNDAMQPPCAWRACAFQRQYLHWQCPCARCWTMRNYAVGRACDTCPEHRAADQRTTLTQYVTAESIASTQAQGKLS